MPCLRNFLKIFPAFHGAAFKARCSGASPSMAYSILRKTISIITVCGQAQPHQSRPNAVGENNDAGEKNQQRDGENDHVLRPENLAEHDELALAECSSSAADCRGW